MRGALDALSQWTNSNPVDASETGPECIFVSRILNRRSGLADPDSDGVGVICRSEAEIVIFCLFSDHFHRN